MISHNEAQTLISARQDQPLDPIVERELSAHLAICDTCRAFAQSTDALTQGLRSLPYLPASPTVRDAVMGRVEQGRSPWARLSNAFSGSFNTAPGPALSTLAIIALVLIVGFFAFNRFVLQDGEGPEDNRQQLASQPTQQAMETQTAEATESVMGFEEKETPEPTATDAATEEPAATETSEPTQADAAQTTLADETEAAPQPTDEPAPTETTAPEPTDEPEPTATTEPEPTATSEPVPTETPDPEQTATTEDAVGGEGAANTTMLAPSTPEDVPPTEEPVDLTQQAPGEPSTPVAKETIESTPVATGTPESTMPSTPTATVEPTPESTPAPTQEPTATPTTEPEEDEAPPIVPIGEAPDDTAEEEPTPTTEATAEPTAEESQEPTSAPTAEATVETESPQIEPIGDGPDDAPIESEATSTPDEGEIQQIEEGETPEATEPASSDDTRDLAEVSELYQDIAGEGDRLLLTEQGRMEFGNVPHAPVLVTEAGRTLEPLTTDNGDAISLCDSSGSCMDISSGTKDGAATDAPIGVAGGSVLYVRTADGVVQYRQVTVEGESVVDDVVLLDGDASIAPQGAVYELGNRFWIPTSNGSWVILAEGEGTVAAGLGGAPQLVRFAPSAEPPLIGYVANGQLVIAPANEPGSPVTQIPFGGVDFDMSPSGDRVAVSDGTAINIYDRSGALVTSYAADDRSPGTVLWLNGGIVYLDTSSGALYQIPETGN